FLGFNQKIEARADMIGINVNIIPLEGERIVRQCQVDTDKKLEQVFCELFPGKYNFCVAYRGRYLNKTLTLRKYNCVEGDFLVLTFRTPEWFQRKHYCNWWQHFSAEENLVESVCTVK
ncbi:MAG: hypothetical protein LBF33_00005, partial [Oscillospiraceae bacterium]|nr:hypothetical protein [Oscillospiraceae bacterium]